MEEPSLGTPGAVRYPTILLLLLGSRAPILRQSLLYPAHQKQVCWVPLFLGSSCGVPEHVHGKLQQFRAPQGHVSPNWFSDFTPHDIQHGL